MIETALEGWQLVVVWTAGVVGYAALGCLVFEWQKRENARRAERQRVALEEVLTPVPWRPR